MGKIVRVQAVIFNSKTKIVFKISTEKGNTTSSSSSSMAKQKVGLKFAKKRAKAMRCAIGMLGVLSVSYEGDKMTVVGEGIDSVALTVLLRKRMGYAELEWIAAIEEKKKEKENPLNIHFEALKRVLRYIHGSVHAASTKDLLELKKSSYSCQMVLKSKFNPAVA